MHTPKSRDLGASQAILELAEAFNAEGHDARTFFPEDATERRPSSTRWGLVRRHLGLESRFARAVSAFVRLHPDRFDVIDANQMDLVESKVALGFGGLVVCRSVGLIGRYHELEAEMNEGRPRERTLRTLVHAWTARRRSAIEVASAEKSLRSSDLVNVSSRDDVEYLERNGLGTPVVYFPLGLTRQRIRSLADVARIRGAREPSTVVFIGTWNTRKGAADWPRIVRATRARVPRARFRFLGVGISRNAVLGRIAEIDRSSVEVVERYRFEDLPRLLEEADVGAFPGYLEGFGIGVLEMLASGLPLVAYDAPGPRDILREFSRAVPVPRGSVDQFVDRLCQALGAPPREAERVAVEAETSASVFEWRGIASRTAACYEEHLERVGREK